MKATDLMIDDWIKLKDAKLGNVNFVGPVVQIKSITGRHVLVPNSKGLLEDVVEEYLLPIPLTPEILEKNGFSDDYCNDDLSYAQSCGDVIGIHINGENGLMDEMYFKFVHELQHALRLCGIEKEIIL